MSDEPTTAQPGSPEKIRVMQRRAGLHLPLFHPMDNKRNDDDHFVQEEADDETQGEDAAEG